MTSTRTERPERAPARLVVLISGMGSLLQALIDACADPAYGASIVAVGADRPARGLERAVAADIPTFVERVGEHADRAAWDRAFAGAIAAYDPDIVVLAGFMKLFGESLLAGFGDLTVNSHPALLPSFPGMHGARDALEHGVKVAGATLFLVDAGVDEGPILAQVCVPVLDADDADTLHERIKVGERSMLVDTIGRMAREGWTVSGRKVTIP